MPTPFIPLGIAHTLVSLVAVASAVLCLARQGFITPLPWSGKLYMGATALAAASALGIYQHGGFGPAHGLAILTLVALAIGSIASWSSAFGRISPVVQTVSLSATLLFHAIPAVTEGLTRLPPSSPLLASAEAPQLKPIYGLLLLVFVIGLTLQLRHLGRKREA